MLVDVTCYNKVEGDHTQQVYEIHCQTEDKHCFETNKHKTKQGINLLEHSGISLDFIQPWRRRSVTFAHQSVRVTGETVHIDTRLEISSLVRRDKPPLLLSCDLTEPVHGKDKR